MYDVLVGDVTTFNGQASVADHVAGDAVNVEQSAIGVSGYLAPGPERRSVITRPAPSTTEANGAGQVNLSGGTELDIRCDRVLLRRLVQSCELLRVHLQGAFKHLGVGFQRLDPR